MIIEQEKQKKSRKPIPFIFSLFFPAKKNPKSEIDMKPSNEKVLKIIERKHPEFSPHTKPDLIKQMLAEGERPDFQQEMVGELAKKFLKKCFKKCEERPNCDQLQQCKWSRQATSDQKIEIAEIVEEDVDYETFNDFLCTFEQGCVVIQPTNLTLKYHLPENPSASDIISVLQNGLSNKYLRIKREVCKKKFVFSPHFKQFFFRFSKQIRG